MRVFLVPVLLSNFLIINPLIVNAQEVSQWILGDPAHLEQGFGIQALPSGNLLVAVNEDRQGPSGSDIGLWRVSQAGELLGRELLGSDEDDFVRGISPAIDMRWWICGMQTSYEPLRQRATLRQVDSLGVEDWHWMHPDTLVLSEFKSVRPGPGGRVLSVGSQARPGMGLDPLIALWGEGGNLLWISQQRDSANDLAHAAWPLQDGSWIVAGDVQMPDLTYRPFAMRISSQDSLMWKVVFDEQLNSGAQQLIGLANGHLLLVGETYPAPGNFYFDVFLRSFSSEGLTDWYRTHGSNGTDAAFDVVELAGDGNLLLTGYGLNPATQSTDAFLLHCDSLGQVLDWGFAGGAAVDYGHSLFASDESVWGTGFSNQGTDSQLLLFRWQDFPNSLRRPGQSSHLLLAPQPAGPGTEVRTTVAGNWGTSYLYRANGQLVGEFSAQPFGFQSFISPEQPGLYFLHTTLNEKPVSFRLLVTH